MTADKSGQSPGESIWILAPLVWMSAGLQLLLHLCGRPRASALGCPRRVVVSLHGLGRGKSQCRSRCRIFAVLGGHRDVGRTIRKVVAHEYGYFGDELYYLACAQRLDWGYVDHPPFCVVFLRIWTALFGTSLLALRVPAAVLTALSVVLVGALTKSFGGNYQSCQASTSSMVTLWSRPKMAMS